MQIMDLGNMGANLKHDKSFLLKQISRCNTKKIWLALSPWLCSNQFLFMWYLWLCISFGHIFYHVFFGKSLYI